MNSINFTSSYIIVSGARPLLNMTVADQEIPDEPNNDITRQHDSLMQRIISSNCHILSHSTLLGFLSILNNSTCIIVKYNTFLYGKGQRYTVRQISENTNSPQWKVRYFMRKLGLRSKNFSDINDANLDVIIRGLLVSFPNAGMINMVEQSVRIVLGNHLKFSQGTK